MKKEMLNITDDEIKPYFNIDSVQVNGVFYAAHRVYGLNFKQRKDIPTYHPDLKVFEVSDKNGNRPLLQRLLPPSYQAWRCMDECLCQAEQTARPVAYNI